ncbi:MAG TPA: DUF3459 domain-containing protein, partial [Acidobacteriaceae bacterium]|nr:DUF3459 domain-containing protein [Acidobacteriaceae bacterium]
SAHHFLGYIQNHDQVGNRALGERLEHLVGMDASKVALGIVLTAPFVPMLFMGEEFAASAPFLYFADHEEEEMRRLVSEGRKRDFAAFGWEEAEVPDPELVETFEKSRLDWSEARTGKHAEMFDWVKQLIQLRRQSVDLNDGNFGHLKVECLSEERVLEMRRGSVRVLANLSDAPATVKALGGESLRLSSHHAIVSSDTGIVLPGMSLAILVSGAE